MTFMPERELNRKVGLASAICMIGAMASSYFLYLDFVSVGRNGMGEPIAKIRHFEEKVRRKAMGAYSWRVVEESQPLFLKDSIQTGPESAAAIELRDGSTIELGEQSLIVLDDSSDLSLQFVRGSGIVHGKDGDTKVSVDQEGKTVTEKLPVRALSPRPFADYYTPESARKKISFQWTLASSNPAATPTELNLEISTDPKFRKETTQVLKSRGDTQWDTATDLAPGRYHWRVTQDDQILIPARSFRVFTARSLKPAEPLMGETLSRWGSMGDVPFRWTPGTDTASSVEHTLEIATDPQFKTPVGVKRVDPVTGLIRIDGLPDGVYYWRLTSAYPDAPVSSAPQKFTLKPRKEVAIALRVPPAKSEFENRPEFRFTWEAELVEGLQYRWELSQLGTGGTTREIAQTTTSSPTAVWPSPGAGRFRWRVSAVMEGRVVGSSNWRDFSIHEGKPVVLQTPQDGTQIHYWETPTHFDFAWTRGQTADEQSLIEIATDPQFTNILKSLKTTEARLNSKGLSLAPGEYHWRVTRLDREGLALKTSPVSRFEYGQPPLLPAATLVAPVVGRTYNPLAKAETPELVWEKVEGAIAYEVVIHQKPTRAPAAEKVFKKVVTEKTSLALPGLNEEGEYTWTVRPLDRIRRPGTETPHRKFIFTYGARLKAPKILAPEVQ